MELSAVRFAALNLTHDCNLRCTYCYAGPKIRRSMTARTAFHALDFLAGQADGPCTVTFFGGEPLLEYRLIRRLVEYSRKTYDSRIAFRMSTNGTLVTPAVLDFCRKHDIYFALSIDGSREQHDRCRRYAGSHGSYGDIEGRIPSILHFNPYTIAVSVIVPETAAYLAAGVRELFSRGFRYVLQTLDYSAPWKSQDIAVLKGQYVQVADYYADALTKGSKVFYSPFDERIKTWAQESRGPGDICDLANSQLAIAPSGRLYPCVQFIGSDDGAWMENAIGDVAHGFDAKKRQGFIISNRKDRLSCAGCALYGRCATFCGCVNWRATGDLCTIPAVVCEHEHILMPIVDAMANRLWSRKTPLFKRKFYERTYPVSSYIEDCMCGRGGKDA